MSLYHAFIQLMSYFFVKKRRIMALLKFEVKADYDKVIRLREEINKLKQEIVQTSLSG